MINLKHTPGPWRWNGDIENFKITCCHGEIIDYANYGGSWLSRSDNLENEANARLIAAAPEMLEALKKCRKEICFDCLGLNIVYFGCECKYVEIIDAAIEKATGLKIEEIL